MANIIRLPSPQPKQVEFLTSRSRYTAYGGARGGGKTWVARIKYGGAALHFPGIQILVVRKTLPELRENHILPFLKLMGQVTVYNKAKAEFNFHNGSRVRFGYLDSEADLGRYQGTQYDMLFIDEATQFTYREFTELNTCVRGDSPFPKRTYLTCNPGGVGHDWVKRLFIDREYIGEESPDDYTFIQAKVTDNPALLENTPDYIKTLKMLPEEQRRAWLDGDWNVFAGQYFKEFNTAVHVVSTLPSGNYRKFIAVDAGYDMLAALWIAINDDGVAYVYREIHEPELTYSQQAKKIAEFSREAEFVIIPPDLCARSGDTGKTTRDIFHEYGLKTVVCKVSRCHGWQAINNALITVEIKPSVFSPRLFILDCCTNLVKNLPLLTHDRLNVNDVSTKPHEITHAPDALRYFYSYYDLNGYKRKDVSPIEMDYQKQLTSFFNFGGDAAWNY